METKIDVEDLISSVWLRPILWDQNNKKYHNRIMVENNWKEVETELKAPKNGLKKKWKNIRDQFRHELKKIPVPKSGDCKIPVEQYSSYTTWPYFKPLLFLKDQMRPRKSVRSLELEASTSRSARECPDLSNETTLDDFTSGENQDLCDSDEFFYQPKKFFYQPKPNATTESFAIEQQRLLEEKKCGQNQKDSDESFFDSLLPYMRKMEMNEKLLCRMEIQKIIYNFSTKEKQLN